MTINSPVEMKNSRIIVRMANVGDINEILDYLLYNKKHLETYEPKKPNKFYTYDFWKNRIEISIKEFEELKSLRLFIFEKSKPLKVIGLLNFEGICKEPFYSCEMGYSLAKNSQGKGYMTEAIELGTRYIFQELNLKRIMAKYVPYNQKSGTLLKRLGFIEEGYAREYIRINDRWEDLIFTSLINLNWKN